MLRASTLLERSAGGCQLTHHRGAGRWWGFDGKVNYVELSCKGW